MTTRHVNIDTELGGMLLVAHDDALTGAYFEGQKYPPAADAIGDVVSIEEDRLLAQAATEMCAYLAGERDSSTPIANVELVAETAPRGELHVVEGASHQVTVMRPLQVAALISTMLRRTQWNRVVSESAD